MVCVKCQNVYMMKFHTLTCTVLCVYQVVILTGTFTHLVLADHILDGQFDLFWCDDDTDPGSGLHGRHIYIR